MNSKSLIITLVFAFLSIWLTYQPMITMAQPAGPNTGASTSGVNLTTTGTNMTAGGGGTNTSGVNLTTTGTNMTAGGGGTNTSGVNLTTTE
jgi:hypothetical protein